MSDVLGELKVIGLHMHNTSKALNRAIREIERLSAENAALKDDRDEYKGLFEIVQRANLEIAKLAEKEGVLIPVERLDATVRSSADEGGKK